MLRGFDRLVWLRLACFRADMIIDAVFQLLAHLKKRPPFRLNGYNGSGAGMIAGTALVLTDFKAPKTAYFNSLAPDKGLDHGIKNRVHSNFCNFGLNICLFRKLLD